MEFTERRTGNAVVLAPTGRIDMATAKQFEEHLIPVVNTAGETRGSVVVDFSGVDYISSAGLRVLMIAAKLARTSGASVVVASMQPIVQEIYQISGFTKVLPCHTGVTEALAALAPKS